MIGTEFLKGQGLGNQLFCYVSTRCIAIDNRCDFGTAGQDEFANNIHSKKGMYFMQVDLGDPIDKSTCNALYEKEVRIKLPINKHDRTRGCYISGVDEKLLKPVADNTLIYGNLQAEEYFLHHRGEIKQWLKVDPTYMDMRFSQEDVCILNMRGGEYVGSKDLYLRKKYWVNAMKRMRDINNSMRFVIITEDVNAAHLMFPEMEAYHLGMGEDYAALHFAHYLIVSNSSFAFWPAFTSDTLKYLIAPKYWARHNVSDGYWASEQNIYTGWNYLGRDGKLYSAEECMVELKEYKRNKYKGLMNPKINFGWYLRVFYNNVGNFEYRVRRRIKRILCEYGKRKIHRN